MSFLLTPKEKIEDLFLPLWDVFLSNEQWIMQAEDLPTNTVSEHCL